MPTQKEELLKFVNTVISTSAWSIQVKKFYRKDRHSFFDYRYDIYFNEKLICYSWKSFPITPKKSLILSFMADRGVVQIICKLKKL